LPAQPVPGRHARSTLAVGFLLTPPLFPNLVLLALLGLWHLPRPVAEAGH
jgi:hypothetical protein